jgi:hypothetical protein
MRLGRDVQTAALRFHRRRMVQWLSPELLARSGADVLVSSLFGRFADKREIQTAGQDVFGHGQDADELWLDFAADVGDGFDSTYSIASLLARPWLELEGVGALPRGEVLVFGGDEVYPTASREAYEDRFVGPYTAALPEVHPDSAAPWLYAVPGNHDWYDGLTAFLRLFCQRRWIGGWRTRQRRSYFALRLPPPWWLWAIDIQLDDEVDELQVAYFREVGRRMSAGDKLVLLTAKPSWIEANGRHKTAYRNLAFIERRVVPDGVELAATITGDSHHYARFELAGEPGSEHTPRQRVTAGGGGAYLSPTHTLPPEIEVPREPWREGGATDGYGRKGTFPPLGVSRRLSWGTLAAAIRTPSFAALVAVLYAAIAATMLGALNGRAGALAAVARGDGWAGLVADAIGGGSVVVALALAAGLVGYADAPGWPLRILAGLLHALGHLALVVTALWLVTRALSSGASEAAVWLAGVGGAALAGAVAGSLLFGAYLLAMHRALGERSPRHTNDAFAGQGIDGHKCFLRMHVRRDGPITVHPIGLERACREWALADGDAGGPLIVPASEGELRPVAIEEPFTLL